MARPSLEDVLQVVSDATPLLEELKAAKATLDGYVTTAKQYADAAEQQKLVVANIVLALQEFADEFVNLYNTAANSEEV